MPVYNDGEIQVQEMAQAREEADWLLASINPILPPGANVYLNQQIFAAITWHDDKERLWITPISGDPGFLFARDEQTAVCDLHSSKAPLVSKRRFGGEPAALVVIDFRKRRRMRINGIAITDGTPDDQGNQEWLQIKTMQVYGNCPKYIQRREPVGETDKRATDKSVDYSSSYNDGIFASKLNKAAQKSINNADTFFIGTFSEDGGADASHRGGNSGFVKADEQYIRWLDYPGNNMFNTLGNIQSNRETALLFPDFTTRNCLIVNGQIETFEPSSHGHLATQEIVLRVRSAKLLPAALSTEWTFIESSPYNP